MSSISERSVETSKLATILPVFRTGMPVLIVLCAFASSMADDARQPLPSAAAREKAVAQIKEQFKNELAESTDPAKAASLARKLNEYAAEQSSGSAERYAALDESILQAASAADLAFALEVAAGLAGQFDVNESDLVKRSLAHVDRSAKTTSERDGVIGTILKVLDKLQADERYDQAAPLQEFALALVAKGASSELAKKVKAQDGTLRDIVKSWRESEQAKKTLADKADDPEANLSLGRYLVLVRDDWETGLAHLAKGSDKALATAAQNDLEKPASATEKVAAGDNWWNLAEKPSLPLSARNSYRIRSLTWYDGALSELSGPIKARVDLRIKKYPALAKLVPSAKKRGAFATTAAPSNQFDPETERNAAISLVQLGCQVKISLGGKIQGMNVASVPTDDFWVTQVELSAGKNNPSHDIAMVYVGRLSRLETLDFSASSVTDKAMAAIQNLTTLRILRAQRTNLSDAGLSLLLRSADNLETLELPSSVTDLTLSRLPAMPTLNELDLPRSKVTCAGLARIQAPNLRKLDASSTRITDAGSTAFAQFPNLAELDLFLTEISDASMVTIGALTNLESLNLGRTKVTNAGIAQLRKLSKLSKLYLYWVRVDDSGLRALSGCVSLQELVLTGTPISDNGFKELAGLNQLTSLAAPETAITDVGLKHLWGLTSLRSINVMKTKVTQAGVDQTRMALPQCKVTDPRP